MALDSYVSQFFAVTAVLCVALKQSLSANAIPRGLARRPVYNIAHMVNTIQQVDEAMRLGANAIEADVTFTANGTATWFYHGVPCDCFRWCDRHEEIPALLDYVRRTASADGGIYKERLTLLFLDLKATNVLPQYKYRAGVDIAEKLIMHLWSGVSTRNAMNVLLSIRTVRDGEVLLGALHTIGRIMPLMLSKIGVDVGNNDQSLDAIRHMYLRLGITGHRWQGDGTTNCVSFLRSPGRLYNVIHNRQSEAPYHYVEKAYQWTLDFPGQLRRSLRRGVDAIITNRPDRLAAILREDEFRDMVRPATVYDNPWIRFDDFVGMDRGMDK
uniref:Putative sphingomyelin phosphodiesterase d sphingomyelinase d n=1 Tax=Rhipicephalus pulchellus TaxID=72859 RepID=L7LW81_RHIPC